MQYLVVLIMEMEVCTLSYGSWYIVLIVWDHWEFRVLFFDLVFRKGFYIISIS